MARGATLFRTECQGCHAGKDGRATGRRMDDLPAFLGVIRSANLTAHPTAGVGGLSDEALARVIRNGVLPDGHRAIVMPAYPGLSDADLAAVLGFLRSGDAAFAPEAAPQARPAPSAVGRLILAFVAGVEPLRTPARVAAPPRGPTAEYGRYLAEEVYHCSGCHTAGFGADKRADPRAYAGGFRLADAAGQPLLTANVTPDPETGIGRWSEDDVVRALRDGLRPDGSGIRLMPELRLRLLGDDELHAIARYLATVPPVRNALPRPGAGVAAAASREDPGAALFERYGCVACHGPGKPYRDRLQKADGQPLEEVTARILHHERFDERSPMPVFGNLMDEATARQLAEHVKRLAAAGTAREAARGP